MGTPKQELWVDRYAERLDGAVVWTVGALFDYVSGRTPRAPRWLADNGLEWIFRLAIEPQRMWRRYLLGNPVFLKRVMSEARRERVWRATASRYGSESG
jgi:N-acetylglucosaminyldiphosphoundecaprenol N-acetyl-beta-D-mannosaminyltransferase